MSMQNLKYIVITLLFFVNCSNESSLDNCEFDVNLLVDIVWVHSGGTLADLEFSSDGIYLENNTNDGNWELVNECDDIRITRPSNDFNYKILTLTESELVLMNPVFGEVTYLN